MTTEKRKSHMVHFRRATPKLAELAAMEELPEIPDNYRHRMWSATKVYREIKLTEETDHFIDLMSIHFGLKKDDVILHAVNLLWREVAETLDTDRLKMYEEHLEAVRYERLQAKEAKAIDRAARLKAGMEKWKKDNPEARARAYGNCITWSFEPNKK